MCLIWLVEIFRKMNWKVAKQKLAGQVSLVSIIPIYLTWRDDLQKVIFFTKEMDRVESSIWFNRLVVIEKGFIAEPTYFHEAREVISSHRLDSSDFCWTWSSLLSKINKKMLFLCLTASGFYWYIIWSHKVKLFAERFFGITQVTLCLFHFI